MLLVLQGAFYNSTHFFLALISTSHLTYKHHILTHAVKRQNLGMQVSTTNLGRSIRTALRILPHRIEGTAWKVLSSSVGLIGCARKNFQRISGPKLQTKWRRRRNQETIPTWPNQWRCYITYAFWTTPQNLDSQTSETFDVSKSSHPQR